MEALRMLNPRLRYDQRQIQSQADGKELLGRSESGSSALGTYELGWRDPCSEPATFPDPATKTTIEKAIAAYLAERAEILAPNTQRQNNAILSKLKAFSE